MSMRRCPGSWKDASAQLSGALRMLLPQLKLQLDHLQMRIDEADRVIKKTAGDNEACDDWCRSLASDRLHRPQIIAAIGNGAAPKRGESSQLGSASCRANTPPGASKSCSGLANPGTSYLRRLFVHGARAVLQQSAKQFSRLSAWLAQLTIRTHRNVAAAALGE